MCLFRLFLLSFVFLNNIGLAQNDELEQNRPTSFLYGDYGMSFYKSKFMLSNDASYTYSYSLGIHGGSNNNIGAIINNDYNKTSFSLVSANITTMWQDVIIRYYWGVFYLGGMISSVNIKAENASANVLDAVGNGYGVNLGVLLPLSQFGIFFINSNYVSIGKLRDQNQINAKLASRIDIDIGSLINISRSFWDLIIGYKQRVTNISVSDNSYSELLNTTYLGVRFCIFF